MASRLTKDIGKAVKRAAVRKISAPIRPVKVTAKQSAAYKAAKARKK